MNRKREVRKKGRKTSENPPRLNLILNALCVGQLTIDQTDTKTLKTHDSQMVLRLKKKKKKKNYSFNVYMSLIIRTISFHLLLSFAIPRNF